MTYIGNSNGVGYRIDPYVQVQDTTGPGVFRGSNSVFSPATIIFTLDRDCSTFSINASNVVGTCVAIAFDSKGTEVTRAVFAKGKNSSVKLSAPGPLPGFRTISLVPPGGLLASGLTFNSPYLYSANAPYQAPPVVIVPGDGGNTVDLAKFLQVSVPRVDVTYISDTMTNPSSQTIELRNLAQSVDITVSARGAAGVSFTPAKVDIARGQTVTMTVNFDASGLNKLQDGTSTIMSVFDVSSNTQVIDPVDTDGTTTVTTPKFPKLNTWIEERYVGAPLGNVVTPLTTIFARQPTSTATLNAINYTDVNAIPPQTTVRWYGTWSMTDGNYTFDIRTDDGMRVWLDGTLIIDQWKLQPPTNYSRTIAVAAGNHNIVVEYFNGKAGGVAVFGFRKVGTTTSTGTGGGVGSNGHWANDTTVWEVQPDGTFVANG